MINQVHFEGSLTRLWEYREQRYMRLANHRPGKNGKTASDYVTVQIDPSLDVDPAARGDERLIFRAKVWLSSYSVEPDQIGFRFFFALF